MTSKISVFIVTHRLFKQTHNPIYIPIQVGTSTEDFGYLRENQKDNIAHKNPNFCELTVLYFIWKNIDTPIVGLVHYRRYFAIFKAIKSASNLWRLIKRKPYKQKMTRFLNENDIQKILVDYDCIVPIAEQPDTISMRDFYAKHHHIEDWECVKDIIKQTYPDYFITLEQVEQNSWLHPYNMFIAKKIVIDDYCQWLFSILFEAEKHIDVSTYNAYNQRVFGFLAERLFTVWIKHNQTKYRFYYQSVYFDKTI